MLRGIRNLCAENADLMQGSTFYQISPSYMQTDLFFLFIHYSETTTQTTLLKRKAEIGRNRQARHVLVARFSLDELLEQRQTPGRTKCDVVLGELSTRNNKSCGARWRTCCPFMGAKRRVRHAPPKSREKAGSKWRVNKDYFVLPYFRELKTGRKVACLPLAFAFSLSS